MDIEIKGIDPLATFRLNTKTDCYYNYLLYKEMLKKNILASDRCYANYRHSDDKLRKYEKACFEVFRKISYLDAKNEIKKHLKGPIKTMDFGRLN